MQQPNIILAQLNPVVGDLDGNAEKILAAYAQAGDKRAGLVICPELSLIGYPPEDLLLMPSFRAAAMQRARKIAASTTEAGLVFGTVWEEGGAVYNAAVFASDARIQNIHFKIMLPNDGIFDEKRHFTAGHKAKVFEWNGTRMALLVCEDIWHLQYAQELSRQHAEMIIVINSSPFEMGKLAARKKITALAAQVSHTPIIYANMMGGQDDIVFDGGSFVVNSSGYVVSEAPQFAETLHVVRSPLKVGGAAHDDDQRPRLETISEEHAVWKAMETGLGDYVRKNGFSGVLLGLSGGIDSAVSAAVAVDALGAANVRGVLLPSPYTSQASTDDALELAANLTIKTDIIPITPMMETARQTLHPLMGEVMEDVAVGGNIQARIRGQLLMALSNKTGLMLLSTGNKSEIAVGYTTLYGDACGGYNCIKDVYKTQVYTLAEWRNGQGFVIPARSLTKVPSAELAPNQKDSDQLPEYPLLDKILALHLEGRKSAEEIVAQGFDVGVVKRVVHLVRISEYKRRQSAPGVKITSMMFGRDRRYPLTNHF
ncbi:MAG: NAD+ synthase [Alphaproteobacteria bacterium]|nr:NAD+ synthase [Alphaproteobacteria bacterium]